MIIFLPDVFQHNHRIKPTSLLQNYVRRMDLGLTGVWKGIAAFSWVRLSIFAVRVRVILAQKDRERDAWEVREYQFLFIQWLLSVSSTQVRSYRIYPVLVGAEEPCESHVSQGGGKKERRDVKEWDVTRTIRGAGQFSLWDFSTTQKSSNKVNVEPFCVCEIVFLFQNIHSSYIVIKCNDFKWRA